MAATRPVSPSTPIGMSYRAAMVPMIWIVVGTVLRLTRVTDTAGMDVLLATAFFISKACVRRKASNAIIAAPVAAASHTPRREVSHEPGFGDASFNNMAMSRGPS
jgi:hypothetical protein